MTPIGRKTEEQRFWSMVSRYTGGVMGYYGMSGLGKTTLLRHLETEIRAQSFTPYIAYLDFADGHLNEPVAAFLSLLDQIEATGHTIKKKRWLFGQQTPSPLLEVRNLLQRAGTTINPVTTVSIHAH